MVKKRLHIMFVCRSAITRSVVFANKTKEIFRESIQSRAAGIDEYARRQFNLLTKEQMEWAHIVYVMDYSQKLYCQKHFDAKYMDKVQVIGVSDEYSNDDMRLDEIFKAWMEFEQTSISDKIKKLNEPKKES